MAAILSRFQYVKYGMHDILCYDKLPIATYLLYRKYHPLWLGTGQFRVALLASGQSSVCTNVSESTLMNMGKYRQVSNIRRTLVGN